MVKHSEQAILIVGAGPAGSMAAVLLARAGMRVVLVEQHRFPRDKVCGECLSAVGIAALRRAGLEECVGVLGPVRLTHTVLVSADGHVARHVLPGEMWGVTRGAMDLALLDAAREAGAEIIQPGRVERLTAGSAAVRLADNTVVEVPFRLALLADGKSALFGDKPKLTGDMGIKIHFRGVAADRTAIHLFALPGFYGGLAAVEGGLWNVAISVPQPMVRRYRGDLRAIWQSCLGGNAFLAEAFKAATMVGEFLASPLARFPVRTHWPEGIIPLGNAAAALEPIGGEGMGLALRSAETAAEAIVSAAKSEGSINPAAIQASYRKLWRVRRAACRAVAVGMSRPALANAMVPLSVATGPITRAVLRAMGK